MDTDKTEESSTESGVEFSDFGAEHPNAFGMKVTGRVTGEAITGLVERIEGARASGGKARIFVDLVDYDGYDIDVVREKLSHMGTLWSGIEKLAYVVDKDWMAKWIALVDAVTPMHLRAFEQDEGEHAKAWLLK